MVDVNRTVRNKLFEIVNVLLLSVLTTTLINSEYTITYRPQVMPAVYLTYSLAT